MIAALPNTAPIGITHRHACQSLRVIRSERFVSHCHDFSSLRARVVGNWPRLRKWRDAFVNLSSAKTAVEAFVKIGLQSHPRMSLAGREARPNPSLPESEYGGAQGCVPVPVIRCLR